MSWRARLVDDRGHDDGEWGYTHNTNDMIAAAMDEPVEQCAGPLGPIIGPAWWNRLDGLPGPEGAALLHRIVRGLRSDPARFDAMNPPNGWGNYDSLVDVLEKMRDAVPEWPTTWEVYG